MKSFANNNNRYKIATVSGFKNFIGVTKSHGDFDTLRIECDDGGVMTLTPDHKIFITDDKSVKTSDLSVGMRIYSKGLFDTKITSITETKSDGVYDILHVEDVAEFIIEYNGLLRRASNCIYL